MKKTLLILGFLAGARTSAQVKIVAHRGYWQAHPQTTENSLASLRNAQALKVYGSEFDVRMTKDGKLVVNHDEHHAGKVISDTKFRELRKAKLSNGEPLPTLKSYLKQGHKAPEVALIVEIKPAGTKDLEDELVEKTLKLVKKTGAEQQCQFISFSKNICLEIKKRHPEYFVQYLNGDLSPAEVKALNLDGIDYHYKIFLEKHPTWIGEARALGLLTNAWTVNDSKIFHRLKDQGISIITTNIPDQLQSEQ